MERGCRYLSLTEAAALLPYTTLRTTDGVIHREPGLVKYRAGHGRNTRTGENTQNIPLPAA